LTTFFLKEMFPLGRLPMIEHTIIELKRSGIKGICVVIRKGKELIEEYLKGRGYKEIEISFAYQRKALGIGDALRRARNFVGQTPLLLWPFQTRCFYQKSLQHDNYWSRERKQREYDTR
jgi:dTDP-glucose pyrophosphorylase